MTEHWLVLVPATCAHVDHRVPCLPKEWVRHVFISREGAIGVVSWSRVTVEVLLGGLATDITQRRFHQVL